jgi:7,8-dihydro-6-hydroxymethylpterin-pyrophosphokinase
MDSGRQRTRDKFAPRTLDLDLLLFVRPTQDPTPDSGARTFEWRPVAPDGALIHKDVETRAFVALPLLEVAPGLRLPPDGKALEEIASRFPGPGGPPELDFTAELRERFLST